MCRHLSASMYFPRSLFSEGDASLFSGWLYCVPFYLQGKLRVTLERMVNDPTKVINIIEKAKRC